MWYNTDSFDVDGRVVRRRGEVRAVTVAAERLRAGSREDMTPTEMAEELIQLRHACDLLELHFAALAAEFAATEEYERWGSVSPVDWIRHECRMSAYAAANAVCVGEQAAALPESVAAVAAGAIGFPHLTLLASTARAVRTSPTPTPALASPVEAGPAGKGVDGFDETALLAQAREHSVSRFRFDCAHARHAGDALAFLEQQNRGVEFRRLELSPCGDGGLALRGLLDAVGGAALRTALEPLARRSGRDDERNRERRLADALVELSHHALDSGGLPSRGGQRPHLQVTASVETLQGLAGAPAGELAFSVPIAAATVQRLACDAGVTRVLLGADSAVIDVGRALRVPSGATRKALATRDGGCVWRPCDRPAAWTEAHHLRHWAHDGPTDLANLALLCYRHHLMVHEGGWQLVRTDDRGVIAIPPVSGDRFQRDPLQRDPLQRDPLRRVPLQRARAPDQPAA
jgi:hypothetical protein